MKPGQKPISQRPAPSMTFQADEELFGNMTTIPADIKKELDEQGFEGRWIDATKLAENSGYHPKGWIPYRRKKPASADANHIAFGSHPEGIIQRGTMILAYKPLDQAERHRAFLRHKASLVDLNKVQRGAADKLKSLARDNGVQSVVTEGYEQGDKESD